MCQGAPWFDPTRVDPLAAFEGGAGEICSLKFVPEKQGIYPFYCTDFCSALHQEMQGYLRVSAKGANTPLKYGTGVIEKEEAGK